ncbi:NAD(P)/FAD-dependent oxidoreductase [Vineibacter terrae]|uniref:NAD(P)/FAD-dependent oxidoreductase n=1 Tax=Vineibacter terrae TaxID=2586908 RepID=A0A5C8PL83_9HYPH|nr:NAD(P)/FAD-dependent oxidoreductase [Vineibacter terrae]TXL74139.1 NAD(P)/FAD-dependent oxidoreductase [Vineibacter terrae]
MKASSTATRARGADFDAIVVGAGFGGLYAVHKLRDGLGLDVQAFDSADDVGGTWYWNRYPGALSDTESYCYRFSFDKELLQQGHWKSRYLTQPEILDYLSGFADRFDLRRSYQFGTKVTAARFDESAGLWNVTTDKGRTLTAKYLVTGLGLLSATNKPPFKGIDGFKGETYHTGAWPEGIDLAGKRVGVIGTGSTGVQVIIALAPVAKHLTVLQRSAQYVVPIGNGPESEERINEYKAQYEAIWKQVKESAVAFGFAESTVPAMSVSEAQRERVFEDAWKRGGGFYFMFATFSDIATSPEANAAAADFIKRKIAGAVKDPDTARKLMPTDLYAKRPLCGTDYYDVYNRANVTLADVKADPIAEFTPTGIRLQSGAEHELDVVVFATGFDAVDGNYTRIDMRGRSGVTIREKWKEGPLGYLGMMESDFPNFFMILGPNGPFTNLPPSIETQVEWISDTIAHMERKGARTVEPTQAAEDEWIAACRTIADMTLFPKAQSWIFGANIPGKKNAVMFYMAGLCNYTKALNSVKESGYGAMIFDREPAMVV